jgi:hypothetical protein
MLGIETWELFSYQSEAEIGIILKKSKDKNK